MNGRRAARRAPVLAGLAALLSCSAPDGRGGGRVPKDAGGQPGSDAGNATEGGSGDGGAGEGAPGDGGAPGRGDGGAASDAWAGGAATDDLQYCVDEMNRYRATLGRAPYVRSAALETFAAAGAMADGISHMAHGHFLATGGGGVAEGENEIPGWLGWKLSSRGSVHEVIRLGLAGMWAEGPGPGAGHGHYENMASTRFTQVGCGIHVDKGDEVTVVQDFK